MEYDLLRWLLDNRYPRYGAYNLLDVMISDDFKTFLVEQEAGDVIQLQNVGLKMDVIHLIPRHGLHMSES